MPLPQAKDSITISVHEDMSETEFINSLDQLNSATHRLLQLAIARGKRGNDYSFIALAQAGTGTNVAQYWAKREAAGQAGMPMPQGGGNQFGPN